MRSPPTHGTAPERRDRPHSHAKDAAAPKHSPADPDGAQSPSTAAPGEAQAARRVGDWVLGEQIGSGSFAVVWKAVHVESGVCAAVKEIHYAKLQPKLQDSLRKEIRILRQAQHPNVVSLIEVLQEGHKRFIVLEYLEGGDLAGLLKRNGKQDEATVQFLMRQLVDGLKYLRSLNLVHRDLKPQNLLLSDQGARPVLKIADFGFARPLAQSDMAETLCGSPLYMAPEILGYNKYDCKADLWSVGAILFELLTGRPPFMGQNPLALLRNIENGRVQIPSAVQSAISPECRTLIGALLRKNPVERIPPERLFKHPFLRLALQPTAAHARAHARSTLAATRDVLPFALEEDYTAAPRQGHNNASGHAAHTHACAQHDGVHARAHAAGTPSAKLTTPPTRMGKGAAHKEGVCSQCSMSSCRSEDSLDDFVVIDSVNTDDDTDPSGPNAHPPPPQTPPVGSAPIRSGVWRRGSGRGSSRGSSSSSGGPGPGRGTHGPVAHVHTPHTPHAQQQHSSSGRLSMHRASDASRAGGSSASMSVSGDGSSACSAKHTHPSSQGIDAHAHAHAHAMNTRTMTPMTATHAHPLAHHEEHDEHGDEGVVEQLRRGRSGGDGRGMGAATTNAQAAGAESAREYDARAMEVSRTLPEAARWATRASQDAHSAAHALALTLLAVGLWEAAAAAGVAPNGALSAAVERAEAMYGRCRAEGAQNGTPIGADLATAVRTAWDAAAAAIEVAASAEALGLHARAAQAYTDAAVALCALTTWCTAVPSPCGRAFGLALTQDDAQRLRGVASLVAARHGACGRALGFV